MAVLGLDVSRETTGFAVGGPAGPRSGAWSFPADLTRALVSLRQAVAGVCRLEKVTHTFIERPIPKQDREHGTDALIVLSSLVAVAREAAAAHGSLVETVPAPTWRKAIYSDPWPSEPKERALRHCALLGYPVATHDEAEARLIWLYGLRKMRAVPA